MEEVFGDHVEPGKNQTFSWRKSALTCLENKDEKTWTTWLNWKKAPLLPDHREQVEGVHRGYRENPNIQEYISRVVNETDELVKKRVLVNFFIHASLAGIPKQRVHEEKLGLHSCLILPAAVI